jgi:hypothetical protein
LETSDAGQQRKRLSQLGRLHVAHASAQPLDANINDAIFSAMLKQVRGACSMQLVLHSLQVLQD